MDAKIVPLSPLPNTPSPTPTPPPHAATAFTSISKRLRAWRKTGRHHATSLPPPPSSPLSARPTTFRDYLVALWHLMARVFPIITWLPQYNWREQLLYDFVGAVTVVMLMVPQGLSFARLAGLPPVYGLYTWFIGPIFYAFFTSSRHMMVGSNSMTALMTYSAISQLVSADFSAKHPTVGTDNSNNLYLMYLTLLVFFCGVFQLLLGLLQLSFLLNFISEPVMEGFTAAVAITIATSQLRYELGYKTRLAGTVEYQNLQDLFLRIGHEVQPLTLGLSIIWLFFLMLARYLGDKYPKSKWKFAKRFSPMLFFVLGIAISEGAHLHRHGVQTILNIPKGFIAPVLPDFTFTVNTTCTHPTAATAADCGPVTVNLGGIVVASLSISVVGFLQTVALGRTMGLKYGYSIDVNQEFIAIGITNLLGSFFHAMPIGGSFSCTSGYEGSGGSSQIGGLISSFLMLITILFVTPAFRPLPNFVLGAIIISSVLPLIKASYPGKLFRYDKSDLFVYTVALLATLTIGVEYGLATAIGLSLIFIIREASYPPIYSIARLPGSTTYLKVHLDGSSSHSNANLIETPGILNVRIDASLYFANANFVHDALHRFVLDDSASAAALGHAKTTIIVMNLDHCYTIDSTSTSMLATLWEEFRRIGVDMLFAGCNDTVFDFLVATKFVDKVGRDKFFVINHEAMLHARHRLGLEESHQLAL